MLFTRASVIPVVYASTSGNVERVVEEVARIAVEAGLNLELHRAEQTKPDIFAANSTFVIATSTWEHGELNPFFVPLYSAMKEMPLTGKEAAFIGLGDRRYEPVLFCEGMEKVRRRWLEQGGVEVIDPLKIQGEPYGVLQSVVEPWTRKLLTTLQR